MKKVKAIGYLRVSTDKQDAETQRSAIAGLCSEKGWSVKFVEEVISSKEKERKIFELVDSLKAGNVLVVWEVSRLARDIFELFEIARKIIEKGAGLVVMKPALEIQTGDLMAKGYLAMLGWMAEVERDFISQRTKRALEARKRMGIKLGRPKGRGKKVLQRLEEMGLTEKDVLKLYTETKMPISALMRYLKLNRGTIEEWLKNNGLKG